MVVLVAMLLSACGGYDVEPLGNSADERLSAVGDGDGVTFSDLLDIDECERVEVIGSYTSDDELRAQVGNANVSLNNDFFTLIVAFDLHDRC